jgi:hypothetical protein
MLFSICELITFTKPFNSRELCREIQNGHAISQHHLQVEMCYLGILEWNFDHVNQQIVVANAPHFSSS